MPLRSLDQYSRVSRDHSLADQKLHEAPDRRQPALYAAGRKSRGVRAGSKIPHMLHLDVRPLIQKLAIAERDQGSQRSRPAPGQRY